MGNLKVKEGKLLKRWGDFGLASKSAGA